MATTAVSSSTTATNTASTSTSSTSSTTGTSSTAKQTAANIVKTLGAGSGIDINSLAQSLVEAEQAPQRDRINAKITQTQSRITGYNAVKYALADLKTAFSALKDASAFNSLNASNSQPTAFSVSTTSAATTGTYAVAISQIAKEQRSVASFSATTTNLSASDFDLTLTVGATTKKASVTTHTPAGMVDAINNSADFKALGVSAQLIDTGVVGASRYKLVVSGATGASNAFTLTSASTTPVTFTSQQAAADANFSVNGIDVTRSSNTASDVVQGVTFNLYDTTGTTSTTSGGVTTTTVNSARLALSRDTTAVKSKVKDLVTAYNSFVDSMNVLSDPKSTVDTYGGALAGDTLLRSVREQIRNLIIGDSSSPGSNVKALRDVGVSLDRYGKLQLSQATLDSALTNRFDEVVKMFSANTENQSLYSTDAGGVAGDMTKSLDRMLRSTGLLALQTKTAQDKVTQYNDDLTKLQDQMQRLQERYMKQFTIMDSIVGDSTSMRTSLQSSFDGMMSMYKK